MHTTDQVKDKIRKAIAPAAAATTTYRPHSRPGTAALVIALREELGDVNRHLVDQALLEMVRAGEVYTYPESAQGDLSDLERALALRVGSLDHHWVQAC